jgi:dipeptidyl-peptidase-3
MFVAMHEVIGHGSGRMSPDCPEEPEFYLREYNQTLEEARADLVALWHFFDPRLLELGLISCPEVAEEGMALILRRSLTIIGQLPQPHAEEDHDRAELLITGFLRQETDAVEVVQQNGRTFWKVRDLAAMRAGVGKLLADLMRIKATGDYQAIHDLVERYAVRVDPDLHRELRDRIHALKLPEYVAFVNPRFELIRDEQGALVDAKLEPQRFEDAQRALSRRYREAEGL